MFLTTVDDKTSALEYNGRREGDKNVVVRHGCPMYSFATFNDEKNQVEMSNYGDYQLDIPSSSWQKNLLLRALWS